MQTTMTVQKLCESWWENLSQSTRDDQYRFAEKFLALHGWGDEDGFEPTAVPGQPTTIAYMMRAGNRGTWVAYFVLPGVLDPPGNVVKRGLDFCDMTRALVNTNRVFGAPYAFITDLFRSYLYDAKTDELLLYADTPAQFVQEFSDVLNRSNVEDGGLDGIRRQPRSYVARQLRDWIQRWSEVLEIEWHAKPEAVGLALDRLIALRFLLDHDIANQPDWRLAHKLDAVISMRAGTPSPGCGRRLTGLFEELYRVWGAALYAPQPPLEAILEQDALAIPLLREFSLLSRTKFTVPTILESFNFGDAAEKARVRMIPEENPDRQAMLAQQTFETVDEAKVAIDLQDEGYRSIFHWFDRLTEVYERVGVDFEYAKLAERGAPSDMDLLGWSEMDSKRPHALTDPIAHAAETGLIIYCTSLRQVRTARLLLFLHVIARYEKTKTRVDGFPNLDAAIQQRPRVLEVDRRNIYQPQSEGEWEVI